jgi:ABC-2 type transport system ATP-binding protein
MDRNGIEAERLVRRFKDVDAVNGIDLTVAPGEIYGFLGPNGLFHKSSNAEPRVSLFG